MVGLSKLLSELLCCAASPYMFPSLLAFTDPSHITFGTDFPNVPDAAGAYFTRELDRYFVSDATSLAQINCGTAAKLFPRFQQGQKAAKDEL